MTPTITLVDRPDAPSDDDEFAQFHDEGRERQRTYKVSDGTTTHTVRIQRDPNASYGYIVENLVGNKWHKLLTGDTENMKVPFDKAAARAAAVLL